MKGNGADLGVTRPGAAPVETQAGTKDLGEVAVEGQERDERGWSKDGEDRAASLAAGQMRQHAVGDEADEVLGCRRGELRNTSRRRVRKAVLPRRPADL